ncbi:hypothetical protein [Flavobacterium algicola]|uniref:hypothetical protein n=1 Tax=Flavobacterium algicola TaxID=556529 RepID=UPI001EFD4008|nr:hypothetical protein [Flavobacterium algicola]MCG9792467.1 hypothetical protein [Flavobacterium algicola]
MKKVINYIVLSLVFILVLSCGARKADKSKTSEVVKSEIIDKSKSDKSENVESNVKTTEATTINNQDQTTTVKKTVEPVDPTKPASYIDEKGVKKELHNSKEVTETTTRNNNTQTQVKSQIENSVKTDKKEALQNNKKEVSDVKKENKESSTERQAWNPYHLIWIFIIIAAIVWLIWRYKTNIFGIKKIVVVLIV